MASIKMDFYVNVELRAGSRFYVKTNPIISVGIRNATTYVDGDPTKVVSVNDIVKVYVIKDGAYKHVDIDTFIALYRSMKRK